MLLALLFALGPHAEEAALHAADAEAAWVRAPAGVMQFAQSAPALTKRVYGYLPYWVSIDLATFRWELVSDVIAFSAGIGADGTVSNSHSLPGAALVQAAHSHGVKVHLCATLFNSSGGSEVATFLGSAAAQSKTISQLASLAKSAGIDGVNLDFEFVSSGGRDQFTAFVQQLHAALAGLELTLAMPATVSYSGYDVPKLAAAAERLLLMEYDYHWRAAPTSGANAPLNSVTNAVGGFLAQAPAASIAMGVPYYGYDWPTATASAGASTTAAGTTVLFNAVFGKFTTYGRLWDSPSQTPWYSYAASGVQHQGWVDDDQSLALKFQLANTRSLAGVMIWALGYDAGRGEAWDALNAAFGAAPDAKLQIVSVSFSPVSLNPGELVTATLHVKNVGGQTIGMVAPPPSVVYDEPQSSTGSISGTWRVALASQERPDHPWRWGIGQPLGPGAELDVSLPLKLEKSGTRTLWAAVIHEGVEVGQDDVGRTQISVSGSAGADGGQADGGGTTDGGAGVVVEAAHGCAETGGTPAWGLLVAALAAARRRRIPPADEAAMRIQSTSTSPGWRLALTRSRLTLTGQLPSQRAADFQDVADQLSPIGNVSQGRPCRVSSPSRLNRK